MVERSIRNISQHAKFFRKFLIQKVEWWTNELQGYKNTAEIHLILILQKKSSVLILKWTKNSRVQRAIWNRQCIRKGFYFQFKISLNPSKHTASFQRTCINVKTTLTSVLTGNRTSESVFYVSFIPFPWFF